MQMVRKWQVLVSSSSPVFNNNTTYLKYYLDCAVPVFTRPAPTTCSCSIASTCTSGDNTPPLLLFNRSSISGGSQSSINLSQIYFALSNATHMITLCLLLEETGFAPVLKPLDTNRGTPNFTFHTPPCIRPLKKRC